VNGIQKAMEKVQGGHKIGHTAQSVEVSSDQQPSQVADSKEVNGALDRIRTCDLLVRSYGCVFQFFHQFLCFHCLSSTRGICLSLKKNPFGTSYIGF